MKENYAHMATEMLYEWGSLGADRFAAIWGSSWRRTFNNNDSSVYA